MGIIWTECSFSHLCWHILARINICLNWKCMFQAFSLRFSYLQLIKPSTSILQCSALFLEFVQGKIASSDEHLHSLANFSLAFSKNLTKAISFAIALSAGGHNAWTKKEKNQSWTSQCVNKSHEGTWNILKQCLHNCCYWYFSLYLMKGLNSKSIHNKV